MEQSNIHIATENEAKENKRKQQILLDHGINVKIDGSWGPWQQRQWNKIQQQIKKEKALIRAKKIECIIGIIFLIPVLIGCVTFSLGALGVDNLWGDLFYNLAHISRESVSISGPVFLGLMGLSSAYLLKDSLQFLYR